MDARNTLFLAKRNKGPCGKSRLRTSYFIGWLNYVTVRLLCTQKILAPPSRILSNTSTQTYPISSMRQLLHTQSYSNSHNVEVFLWHLSFAWSLLYLKRRVWFFSGTTTTFTVCSLQRDLNIYFTVYYKHQGSKRLPQHRALKKRSSPGQ